MTELHKVDIKGYDLALDLDIGKLRDEFIYYCENVRCYSKWTMTTRKTHLKQFIGYLQSNGIKDVRLINNLRIDDYMIDFCQSHNQNTANTARRIIRSFFKWINDYKELSTVVRPDAIRLVKVRDGLPKAIDRRIIHQVVAGSGYQDALMIATMFEGGLRISEAVNLKASDLSGNNITIVGKGNIERTVYLTDQLANELRGYRKRGYIFQNVCRKKGTGKMTTKTACRRIEQCFLKFGIKMHPHQLRHSLAIALLEGGADVVTIQKVLGHADISTTMVYLKVHNEFVKNSYNQHLGGSILT